MASTFSYDPGPGFHRSKVYIDKNGDGLIKKDEGDHGGIDYAAAPSTKIPAAAGGEVIYSGFHKADGYGWTVIIRHEGLDGNVFYTLYGHMKDQPTVNVGDQVTQGRIIGEVGSSGRSTGNHLHFEVIDPGEGIEIIPGYGGDILVTPNDPYFARKYRVNPDNFHDWPPSGFYNPCYYRWFPVEHERGDYNFATTAQSPLILDLDGDGAETTSVNDGVYFDHDRNGFAEQTGWASSDDGLLVWDRNGDGVINDGKELFGDQTLLKNGSKASNGFQALAEWDDNLNGKIDPNDSIWSNLKVWQDFYGDGYSSSDELLSLSGVGVASINTGYTTSSFVDPNGNEYREMGGFNRTDGTTGAITDVWFKTDKMFTIANEWLDVPEDIASLPDLQGYGNVYDLHQAMVRDTSGQLKSLVENFIAQTDVNTRSSLMEQILFKWTGVEGIDPNSRGPNIDARRLAVLEKLFGEAFVGIGGIPTPNLNAGNLLNQSYQGIFEMYYAGLEVQTHMKDLYDLISYTWDAATQSLRGDLSAVVTELQTRITVAPVEGKGALGEFARTIRGFQAEEMLDYRSFRDTFVTYNEEMGWIIDSGGKNIIIGTALNDSLTGTGKHDAIAGGDGNDILSGDAGDDILYGQGGNDTLNGQDGNDYLYGGLGDDTLIGDQAGWSVSADTLDGGPGNDSLQGGAGNDTYLFGRGYGVDTIVENDATPGNLDTLRFASDISRSDVEITRNGDTLVFRIKGTSDQVVVPSWITGARYRLERMEFGDGTVLTGDEVTTISEEIRGTSGNDVLNGSSIRDRIYGESGDDTLNGNAGDDLLEGGLGNDTLIGDQAGWSVSADTLDGGPGNDSLQGGAGNDTYLFGRGYGVDTIVENDATPGNLDTLRFASDILPSDVKVSRESNNLVFSINGITDQILVSNHFYNSRYQIEKMEFGDGNTFNLSDLQLGTTANDTLNGTSSDSVMMGDSGNDTLNGGSGNDLINGGPGADSMIGGAGNDKFILDDIGDIVTETLNEGTDTVLSSITYALGANVENLTLTGTNAITGTGNSLDNVLTGNSGVNVLTGGAGNDTYIIGTGDTVVENANEGIDTVKSSDTFTLPANVENLTLTGTANINATGNTLNNVLVGNSGANILNGAVGADSMSGGAGDDTYVVDNSGDTVTEALNEGIDTVQSSITYTLGANVENLTLTGSSAINGTGNDLNNTLTGNSGANTFNGGLGTDTMIGGAGNDTYVVDNTGDIITENLNQGTDTVQSSITYTLGSNLENLTLTGTSAINGTGNELNNVLTGNSAANTLTGNAGNDTLNGGAGADSLVGGLGNDTYVVDDVGDVVTEALNEGTDTVRSYITYTLGANVENLTLMGTAAINGAGNSLNNILTGNSAANVLAGGLGNDTYVVGTGDTVVENLNEGTDTVQSSITYTLGSNLENLTLTGTSAINGTGNELNNSITGNSASNILMGGLGNDTLNGGAGADTLIGGLGNDTYVVDNAADVVTEALNEGTDTVQTSITYTLSPNVENLTLTGSGAINGTGNELDNVLTGNSGTNILSGGIGNDTLNGGAGADTMIGGLGNDILVVDNTGDIVTEAINEGTDTIQSSITYTLGANVENLTLTGTSVINGTGNELDNVLTGNSASNVLTGAAGNDTLNGGTGADTLIGGLGNDTYIVDNTGDVVTEALNEGTDKVQSSITYTLNANVENLTLTGTSAINGTGNTLDNVLTGNTGANTLTGGSGNDTLDGGVGNDTLKGETGNDLYLFARGYGSDTINDYDTTAGNSDKAKFNSGLNPLDLIFVNSGNDLNIQIYNGSDLLKVQNQNSSSAYQVEVFEASDGRQLLSSQVGLLIQEMAGFSASTGMSWTQLIQNKPTDVQTILSHYWQPPT